MNTEEKEVAVAKSGEDSFSKSFSTFNKQFIASMEAISRLAEKGPSNLLLSLGTLLFIVSLFMKLEVFGVGLANLESSEFIALILVAALLLLAGSCLRLYQYKGQQEINRELRKAGLEILQRTETTAEDFAKTGSKNTVDL